MTNPITPTTPATAAIAPAQRQRAYRQRRNRAVIDAIGEEVHASRVTLLALLGRDLAVLSDEAARAKHPSARNSARRVMSVLVTRYDINPEGPDSP